MGLATLFETKTGMVHHVRDPSPELWAIAVRRQKKKGLPDRTRFSVWTRCGTYLRANSLSTRQSITCIACLMQTQEEADAREAEHWRKVGPWPSYRVTPRRVYGWTNQIMGQWVPHQPKTAYRDTHGRYRIRLGGVGIQERPITDDVKPRPAWWVDHDGNGGEALPPLRYHKAKDSSGIVHFRTDVAPMVRVLLCGLTHDDDAPPELVKNEAVVNCMGCVAREGLLTWNPKGMTWVEYGGWDGPYP